MNDGEFHDENMELGQLVDPPPYTVTITDNDLLGILNIVEEALMRTDDFIDMDYGSYLRPRTKELLIARREDIRGLIGRLIRLQQDAERAAFSRAESIEG